MTINQKNRAQMTTLPAILPVDYLKSSVGNLFKGGLPTGLFTGLNNLDNIFRLDKGRLATITGVPNYGKSEFVDFLTTTFNKKYGFKTLYFSPENQPVELHVAKLIQKYMCKPFSKENFTQKEMEKATDYIGENFFFFNYSKVQTLSDIVAHTKKLIQDKGIDILVLDAYNKIESEMPTGDMETNFISKILDCLCNLAISMNILVILVAHPKKMEWDAQRRAYKCPTAYDINGSANFFNKSDFVIVVHRDMINNNVIIRVDKVKFSNYGKSNFKGAILKYDLTSGHYYDAPDDNTYVDDTTPVYQPTPFVFPVKDNQHEDKQETTDIQIVKTQTEPCLSYAQKAA